MPPGPVNRPQSDGSDPATLATATQTWWSVATRRARSSWRDPSSADFRLPATSTSLPQGVDATFDISEEVLEAVAG
jgi:hypothetical protein